MPYYGAKGDFYSGRTGYYRRYGDPGFFSNLLGDVKNIVTRNVIPMITGIPAAAATAASAAVPAVSRAISTVSRHPVISAAAAAGTSAVVGGMLSKGRKTISPGVMTLPGAGGQTQLVSVGGRRRRRMHVTNVKALRRAIRRARGFEKIARKVMGFTSPRKPKGRVYFKARRKR